MSAFPDFDLAAIGRALGAAACRFNTEILATCDSTNGLLLARAEAGAPSGTVVVAEQQTAGRGRRGRSWVSAAGDSLTFSLLWRFAPGTSPAGLSLAVGVAVAQAVEKAGAGNTANSGIQLKWPNDILLRRRKLGGILIELAPGVPHAAVIGIGLNRRLPAALTEEVPAAALDRDIDANVLLATVLADLLQVLEDFAVAGFAAQRETWLARHAFQDQPVVLLSDFAPPRYGICRGVAADGALLLETEGRIERILSGEISLRPAS